MAPVATSADAHQQAGGLYRLGCVGEVAVVDLPGPNALFLRTVPKTSLPNPASLRPATPSAGWPGDEPGFHARRRQIARPHLADLTLS
jgi:hypothetical protein